MSKRILIISHCFAPQNKVGAVRATKLAKYLLRMGYEVTVLAGKGMSPVTDPLLASDLARMKDVHIVSERSLLRWWKERGGISEPGGQPTGKQEGPAKARPLLNALYLFLDGRADAAFARACVREAQRMGKRYDAVLSSYGPPSVHTVANRVKRLGLAHKWIADFRDEASVPFAWQKPGLGRYMRMVVRNADRVTSISAGLLRVMGIETNGRVVYNGFDPEDLAALADPPKRTDKLTFIHCGQMYGLRRDLSPFFRALSELIRDGMIAAGSVALVYAGKDTGGFIKQAADAGLRDCLEGHGFLPRDESLKLQKAAHVLLLPAWNLKDRQGNVPGKLLEYMMLEMPVVCCVSGEIPHSEIAGIIRDTNIGFCCEQANQAEDYPRLKAYLADAIRAFKSGEPMPYAPNREAVGGFASEGMARKMANIIEELTD
jgi:glycosyltransferase involved in cell wall biosynthesis